MCNQAHGSKGDTLVQKWEISAIKPNCKSGACCNNLQNCLNVLIFQSIIVIYPPWISTFLSFGPLLWRVIPTTKQASHRMPFSHTVFCVFERKVPSFSDGSIIIKWIWVTISGQFFCPANEDIGDDWQMMCLRACGFTKNTAVVISHRSYLDSSSIYLSA